MGKLLKSTTKETALKKVRSQLKKADRVVSPKAVKDKLNKKVSR